MAVNARQFSEAGISRLLLATLLLISALGATLRIHKLGAESIWLDEAYSIQISHGSLASIINETAKDVHPPLYYFALHYWMQIFGDSEFSTRLLSALFGTLAIFALYKFATLLFNRTTGLLAALLLALSQFHLTFSQEARMYALLSLLSLLSLYFYIKLLTGRSRFALAGYVIFSALMLYTHVFSLFVIIAQNLFWLSLFFASREMFKRTWKRWLLAQTFLFVLFLPWLSVLAQQVSRVQKGFWILKPTLRTLFDTLIIYAGSTLLVWILFPLAALAIFLGWKGRSETETGESLSNETHESLLSSRLKIYLLLLWLVCPLILPFIISQFSTPIFQPKYTIPASLAFIILATRGLLSIRFHQLRMLLSLAILCFSLIALNNYYNSLKKDVWRDAVANFKRLAQPGDLVLFNQQSGQIPFDYYSKRADLIEQPFPDYNSELTTDNITALLKPTIEGHRRVWLVLSHQSNLSPLIATQLGEWYTVMAHTIDPGVEIYLFEKR